MYYESESDLLSNIKLKYTNIVCIFYGILIFKWICRIFAPITLKIIISLRHPTENIDNIIMFLPLNLIVDYITVLIKLIIHIIGIAEHKFHMLYVLKTSSQYYNGVWSVAKLQWNKSCPFVCGSYHFRSNKSSVFLKLRAELSYTSRALRVKVMRTCHTQSIHRYK